jgi:CBS domain-containing protein
MTNVRTGPCVGDLMTPDPVVVFESMPLVEAATLMDLHGVSGLPVVDESGALVGVVSQTDLLHARTTEGMWHAWPGLAVRHLMTRPAISVDVDTGLDDAAELMERLRIHRLVVVDDDGRTPVGVLSVSDLVHSMALRGAR